MTDSYRALCTDFYVNQKVVLRMELPRDRDRVLDMFDRVRRAFPSMDQFRKYRDELALESGPPSSQGGASGSGQWLGIRSHSIRSGCVNPDDLSQAYRLHRHVLESAPYFLSISPLDVDYIELLYGFDMLAAGNHDEIVYSALLEGTPLAALRDDRAPEVIDCQPILGFSVSDSGGMETQFEVKTRPTRTRGGGDSGSAPGGGDEQAEPISVYLTMRAYGPVGDIADMPKVLDGLTKVGKEMLDGRLVPYLLTPIRDAISHTG